MSCFCNAPSGHCSRWSRRVRLFLSPVDVCGSSELDKRTTLFKPRHRTGRRVTIRIASVVYTARDHTAAENTRQGTKSDYAAAKNSPH